VQFILDHERDRRTLRFASLESPTGADVRRRHRELEGVDSLIWVQPAAAGAPERVLVRSQAVFEAARYLGGVWAALAAVGRIVPRVIRDAVYDLIARNRYRISARMASACRIPTSDERVRFLDDS
jgi:predicted DCC family thiol-disulfide oxidoreductase YuxK